MLHNNQSKGKLGEDLAATYLQKKGYSIISRNFNSPFGEIDLIATFKNTLIFIEIKTRSGNEYGAPQEAVTPWKIKSITKTGQYFRLLHPKLPEALQIDVIAISLNAEKNLPEIGHLENVTG